MMIKEVRKLDPDEITDVELMKAVIKKGTVDQKIFLMHNENLPQKFLEQLYDDNSARVRAAAERTGKLPIELMMKNIDGVENYSPEFTHMKLLQRDDLTSDELKAIYEASNDKESVAIRILKHPSCTDDLKSKIKDENADFLKGLDI